MKLSITIKHERSSFATIDDPDNYEVTIAGDMSDCSVHGWFELFGAALGAAGFSEGVIMSGACRLAFNDCRPEEMMKKVAEEYDLQLKEFNDD